jgi:anti-anti-sigma factor
MDSIALEQSSGGRCVLRVRCSLVGPDAKAFAAVIENLIDDLPRDVIVDLGGSDVINSLSLSALLRLHGELEERRGRFTLVNVRPAVRQMLELTSVDDLFEVRP